MGRYMTIDPRTGHLVTGPSISPENAFAINGQHISASMMPTCDLTFAYEILNTTLLSARLLDTGSLQLLPALPKAWSEGRFSGLCIRGGAEVSAQWRDSKILSATLTATADNIFTVQVPGYGSYSATVDGHPITPRDGQWQVSLRKGQSLTIR